MTAGTPRHVYGATVLVGLGGGLLAALGASRGWARVDAAASGMPSTVVTVSGADARPWVTALALVVCASWLAVLATAGVPRRLIGALGLLAAVVVAVGALSATGAVRDAVAAAVEASPTSARGSGQILATRATGTPWPWVTALGAVLAGSAAIVVMVHGHRLPSMGRRYTRPAPPVEATASGRHRPGDEPGEPLRYQRHPPSHLAEPADPLDPEGPAHRVDPGQPVDPVDPVDLWRALDEGRDPTG